MWRTERAPLTGGERHSCKIVLGRIRKEAELSRTVDGLDIGSEGERSRGILVLGKREIEGARKSCLPGAMIKDKSDFAFVTWSLDHTSDIHVEETIQKLIQIVRVEDNGSQSHQHYNM